MSAWPSQWLHLGAEEMAKWAESTCFSVVRTWIWILGTHVKARQCEHPGVLPWGDGGRDRSLEAHGWLIWSRRWGVILGVVLWPVCTHHTCMSLLTHVNIPARTCTHIHWHIVWVVISMNCMNYNSEAYHLSDSCWSRWMCDPLPPTLSPPISIEKASLAMLFASLFLSLTAY